MHDAVIIGYFMEEETENTSKRPLACSLIPAAARPTEQEKGASHTQA
jgi:hypothetical protein